MNWDELHQQTDEHIAENGCTVMMVGSGQCACPTCDGNPKEDGPPFAYTVGLHTAGHPEVLVYSLPVGVSHDVCNGVADRLRTNPDLTLEDGLLLEKIIKGYAVKVRTLGRIGDFDSVHERDGNFGYLIRYAKARGHDPREIEVVQILWPDADGRFPDEDGYDSEQVQPLLDGARA